MKNTIIFGAALATLFIGACKSDIKPEKPMAGEADFSKYIAVGNSLTAGYASNSLSVGGQLNSFPLMLSTKFAEVGGGDFVQPLMGNDDIGWPNAKLVLGYKPNCLTDEIGLAPVPAGTPIASNGLNISGRGPFNNLGVPGIRLVDFAIPGYGALNPYSRRFFTPAQQAQTPLEVAASAGATFFSLWLGNNDILGYAASGGAGSVSGTGLQDLTPIPIFQTVYDNVINAMTASGAKGILITIPDVASTPLFTTIPAIGLSLSRQGQADSLNAAYAPLGIHFSIGANPFVVADAAAPGGRRLIMEDELILLTASDSITCGGWGSIKPIPANFFLDRTELAAIRSSTQAFNTIIAENAASHNLALFDANAYLKTLPSGIVYNGVSYTPAFVTGGIFSLDGVHLNPRGYAIVANQIIKAINAKYKSTLNEVDVNSYPGLVFP